ncbi:MAG: hypothetical protein UZ17_ACD001002933 [Acidobacteria bacterium OLB17]|nr:MAG: hypothetical protein UZ17_ACD001002933 [Acidobacteria bacterium OLB17]
MRCPHRTGGPTQISAGALECVFDERGGRLYIDAVEVVRVGIQSHRYNIRSVQLNALSNRGVGASLLP